MALKKEERESQLWNQQHKADEANMGTVPFGDIELQDHEPGYCSVHTEHIMGRHFGTCQLALMPQLWCNKVRIVDHHKHYNNSAASNKMHCHQSQLKQLNSMKLFMHW